MLETLLGRPTCGGSRAHFDKGEGKMVLRRVLPLVTMAIGLCVFQLSHAQPVRSCRMGRR
jgi:hypothetical protein